jgi:hypothetical protein
MSSSPDRLYGYSPDLLAMTVNLDGEHRVIRLDRTSGKRDIVAATQDPDEAFGEAKKLSAEAHGAFLASLRRDPSLSQPPVAFYAYRPDGSAINSFSQPETL